MSGSLLPHALLDFTLARASARLETLAQQSIRRGIAAAGRRHAHQSALLEHVAAPEYAPFESDGERSLYSRYVSPSVLSHTTHCVGRRQVPRHRTSPLASVGLFPHAQDRPMTELERRISDLKEVPVVEVCILHSFTILPLMEMNRPKQRRAAPRSLRESFCPCMKTSFRCCLLPSTRRAR